MPPEGLEHAVGDGDAIGPRDERSVGREIVNRDRDLHGRNRGRRALGLRGGARRAGAGGEGEGDDRQVHSDHGRIEGQVSPGRKHRCERLVRPRPLDRSAAP